MDRRIVRAMRRLLTLALALGLAALVALATVDALRESDETATPSRGAATGTETETQAEPVDEPATTSTTEPAAPPPWVEAPEELAEGLRRDEIGGTLLLSADGCGDGRERRLRMLRLPDLTLSDGPPAHTCSFTVSANGQETGGPDAVWSPRASILAAPTGPLSFEVIDVRHAGRFGLPGSVPAFAPNGDLTHVQGGRGRVLRWGYDCEQAYGTVSLPVALDPTRVGPLCGSTAVTRKELARALPLGDRLEAVDALAWADGTRLLAVLRTAEGSWLAAFEDGESLGYGNGFVFRVEAPLKVDPTGRYVALSPGGYLEIYDRDAGRAWGSAIRTTAYDWSPDGRWLAYAANGKVHLARTSDWTTRHSFTVSTDSIAWR
jgi:hypothetical protein